VNGLLLLAVLAVVLFAAGLTIRAAHIARGVSRGEWL
jgi:hypothetical protein